jgi:hypothetical protein
MTPPKPYSEAVFIEASRAPPMASLLPSAKLRAHRLPGQRHHQQDAQQQRPLDRPDRDIARHFLTPRLGVPIDAGTNS